MSCSDEGTFIPITSIDINCLASKNEENPCHNSFHIL